MQFSRGKVVSALVSLVVSSAGPGSPQPAVQSAGGRSALAAFARNAAVKALTYSQGDRETLIDAETDFTSEGWREFMGRMAGFVDSKGAPQGSSSFVPDEDVLVRTDNSDVMQCGITGILKQTRDTMTATYQVTVRIELRKHPPRVEHLIPTICGSVDLQRGAGSQPRRSVCP